MADAVNSLALSHIPLTAASRILSPSSPKGAERAAVRPFSLASVNASDYVDTLSVKPRVQDIVGPNLLDIEERSHFVGVISCQFSANA